MRSFAIATAVAFIAFMTVCMTGMSNKRASVLTVEDSKVVSNTPQIAIKIPSPIVANTAPSVPAKDGKTKVITLAAKNTVTLRGPVTEMSVAQLQQELLNMSAELDENDTIYLVLDTPGGEVEAGNNLIDTAKSLPQKVKTITLFAASMGFHIVENLDERIIIPSGTLMSHRVKVGGIGGQVPGEAVTRLNMILRTASLMDGVAAARMQMPLEKYQNMIRDEYWVSGWDAVSEKAADSTALVRCGKDLMGSTEGTVDTMFGPVQVTFSKCPVIRGPLEVKFGDAKFVDAKQAAEVKENFRKLFTSSEETVHELILNEKYRTIIK